MRSRAQRVVEFVAAAVAAVVVRGRNTTESARRYAGAAMAVAAAVVAWQTMQMFDSLHHTVEHRVPVADGYWVGAWVVNVA